MRTVTIELAHCWRHTHMTPPPPTSCTLIALVCGGLRVACWPCSQLQSPQLGSNRQTLTQAHLPHDQGAPSINAEAMKPAVSSAVMEGVLRSCQYCIPLRPGIHEGTGMVSMPVHAWSSVHNAGCSDRFADFCATYASAQMRFCV